jgi:hypothetical protein
VFRAGPKDHDDLLRLYRRLARDRDVRPAFDFFHASGDFYDAGEVADELGRLCLDGDSGEGDQSRSARLLPLLTGYVAFYRGDYAGALAELRNANAADPCVPVAYARPFALERL